MDQAALFYSVRRQQERPVRAPSGYSLSESCTPLCPANSLWIPGISPRSRSRYADPVLLSRFHSRHSLSAPGEAARQLPAVSSRYTGAASAAGFPMRSFFFFPLLMKIPPYRMMKQFHAKKARDTAQPLKPCPSKKDALPVYRPLFSLSNLRGYYFFSENPKKKVRNTDNELTRHTIYGIVYMLLGLR